MKKTAQQIANAVVRKAGYGRATTIVPIEGAEPMVISHTSYGYRKYTTGEYVSNSYRNHFGWRNTYYQDAQTVVGLPINLLAGLNAQ